MRISTITISFEPNETEINSGDVSRTIIRDGTTKTWSVTTENGEKEEFFPAEITLIHYLQQHVINEWGKMGKT